MDKRAFSVIESPQKLLSLESNKKLKVSASPKKKLDENNGNALNQSKSEVSLLLDGLCFDDEDFDDMVNLILIETFTQVTNAIVF
jgi:hypothetical protein